jgi:hypothetical protein
MSHHDSGPELASPYDDARALTDSVVEHFIPLFSNGRVKADTTRAHTVLSEFPYLGPPHGS